MRVIRLIIVLFGVILIHLMGCKEYVNQQYFNGDNKEGPFLLSTNKPKKIVLHIDSLIIRTPGKDGVLLAEHVVSEQPSKKEYIGVNRVFPGVSMLKQTVSEKLAGEPAVRSIEPDIIEFNALNKKKSTSLTPPNPLISKVISRLVLDLDSLPYYKKIAIRKGLISIHNRDTIFPPISLLADNHKRIKALPFDYKENALLDLSVLEANQELPNPFIRDISMDKNDIMWFESHTGGLISYDGQFFDQYIDHRRLTKETGLSMIIDSKGNIWTGTKGGGVYCFDGTYITQYSVDQGFNSANVLDILEDCKGYLWFATSDGITKFDGETFATYTVDDGLAMDYIYSIFEDNMGNIWAGTFGKGVLKFNGKEFVNYTTEDGLCNNMVLSISQDHEGNYWFGTNGGGVSKFNGSSFTNYSTEQGLGNDVILAITEDKENNLWFGTYGNGVTYFDGEAFSNYSTYEGLSDNYVRTIVEDNKGNLWIGTDGSGVSKININSFKHFTKDQGLIDNNITSIYQDRNRGLCLAPFEGGVMLFDKLNKFGELGSFIKIDSDLGLVDNIVVSITQDDENNYWFSTFNGGVSKLDAFESDDDVLKFTNYSTENGLLSNTIRSVFHDTRGNIWFGTEGGATKFNGKDFITITAKNGIGDNNVLNVFEDRIGDIWFGTMDGGASCLKGDTLIRYTTKQGLSSNSVWSIVQDSNGIIWFGTSNGITGFNGTSMRNITTDDGLCNNSVFSMVIDNNNSLWVGTIKGLSQIKIPDSTFFSLDMNKRSIPEIFNYGKMDGLVGLDFSFNSVILDNMNCLWWGTDKALTMLNLSTFSQVNKAPIPHINGIVINNKAINFNELLKNNNRVFKTGIKFKDVSPFLNNPSGLSLPYDLNHVMFRFSATDWSSPNQIQYQYKLLGLDNSWSLPAEENSADYRNIPPGSYTFLVRAKGKSGLWSDNFEISFTVRWPLYLKWWAILLYVFSFGFLIWTIIKWRVSIIEKQKAILEEMVGHRTKELDKTLKLTKQAAEAKSQFIATISHEIRTPLNAIMGLSHLAINSTVDPKQEDYLQKISGSAKTLLTLINEILDFSKIEAGKMQLENVNFDLESVINSVIVLNAQSAHEKKIEFTINVVPDIPRMLIGDPLRIGQIITNLCNNSIKFTSSGEVVINVSIEEELNRNELYLQVAVKDTGIGISEDQIPFLFDKFNQADSTITRKYGGTGLGLSISKLLIEMMDGQIWLESTVGEGTTFFFNFKVGIQKEQPDLESLIPDELKEFNILVCDDNPSSLNSIATTLNSLSLKVQMASSGEEVIEILKTKPYDLLLIDLHLNGISGLDTIISIRLDDEIQPIKTILITDNVTSKTSFEQNISGVDGYLTKPTTSSTILQKVLSVFGMESSLSRNKNRNDSNDKQVSRALSGKRVLLVEDNEINRQVVFELLQKVEVIVDIADNGVLASQMAMESRYDLILMDLHMPIMDGYNSTIQIRNNGIQTPIIAVTADAMGSIKSKCDKVGIQDIILKPIDPYLLYDRLLHWMAPNVKVALKGELNSEDDIGFLDLDNEILDMRSGIKRFGNDDELYFKMLEKFLVSNQHMGSEIKNLLNKNEHRNAHILVHSLKGESGNIGADKVSSLASKIEKQLLQDNFKNFEEDVLSLENSILEINLAYNEYKKKTYPNLNIESLNSKEIILELISCLETKNPRVFDIMDDFELIDFDASVVGPIKNAISNEDQDLAVSLLNKLLLTIENSK